MGLWAAADNGTVGGAKTEADTETETEAVQLNVCATVNRNFQLKVDKNATKRNCE